MLIDLRQLNRYQDSRPDARISRIFERKEFEDSQKYNQEKHKFKMIHELVDTIVDLLLWVGFWYVAIWDWMNQLMSENGLCSETKWVEDATQAYLFVIITYIIQQLINLPFSIYHTFVIEESYGFNKMTPGLFLKDEIKKFFITAILAAIIIPVLLYIIANSGPALVPVLAGVSVGFVIFINLLVPTVILPLFFTMKDLDEGELRDAIFAEAERTNIPVSQIKVIDGSQRSSHSNAFVAGFGSFRKVVLFDTLIE